MIGVINRLCRFASIQYSGQYSLQKQQKQKDEISLVIFKEQNIKEPSKKEFEVQKTQKPQETATEKKTRQEIDKILNKFDGFLEQHRAVNEEAEKTRQKIYQQIKESEERDNIK